MTQIGHPLTSELLREDLSHGPSSLAKRLPAAAVAILGVLIAARLLIYQLGWTGPPWDPFFGAGTRQVVESSLSRSLPIPDASLGLIAYVAEVVAILWGSSARWREQPRVVYLYAAIASGLAVGSAGLVVLQAFVIHAYCTLCLTSALISFALVIPALVELRAAWRARGAR